jgi:hypothetical protein
MSARAIVRLSFATDPDERRAAVPIVRSGDRRMAEAIARVQHQVRVWTTARLQHPR